MKKIFSIFFVMCMLLSLSLTANALTEGDWEYKIVDNGVILTNYKGAGGAVVVPSTIRGCPVVKIKFEGNIWQNKQVTALTLPDTIREINELYMPLLERVNIPRDLEVIGFAAFRGTKLKSVDLSHLTNLKSIGWNAFSGNQLLTDVKLPNYVTEIPRYCFMGCTALQNFDFPSSLTHIMDSAFKGCDFQGTLVFPPNIKELHAEAFSYNHNLEDVIVPYGATFVSGYWRTGQNYIDNIWAFGPFTNCESLKAVYLPDTIENVSKRIIEKSDNCILYVSENFPQLDFLQEHEISYLTDNSVNTKINVLYNGSRVSFHNYNQNPEIVNDRTMVPLRSIFETMGATVNWDGNTQTVTASRGGTNISLQIGANQMYVNGAAKTLDVPAMIMNDRTMVPVRAISEAFGCSVDWDNSTRTVLITQ